MVPTGFYYIYIYITDTEHVPPNTDQFLIPWFHIPILEYTLLLCTYYTYVLYTDIGKKQHIQTYLLIKTKIETMTSNKDLKCSLRSCIGPRLDWFLPIRTGQNQMLLRALPLLHLLLRCFVHKSKRRFICFVLSLLPLLHAEQGEVQERMKLPFVLYCRCVQSGRSFHWSYIIVACRANGAFVSCVLLLLLLLWNKPIVPPSTYQFFNP